MINVAQKKARKPWNNRTKRSFSSFLEPALVHFIFRFPSLGLGLATSSIPCIWRSIKLIFHGYDHLSLSRERCNTRAAILMI